MDRNRTGKTGKGGRPRKVVKRDQLLGVKCNLVERKAIEHKAKETLSVSEYLRELSVNSVATTRKQKSLPKEVLLYTATLNHLAANINQIAYRRNRGDSITAFERLELLELEMEIKALLANIKSYLR